MAEEKGISNIITVTGGLFGDDKWNTYRESDVFVLPTLNENFGIVIAESLLCGTPVITTQGALGLKNPPIRVGGGGIPP